MEIRMQYFFERKGYWVLGKRNDGLTIWRFEGKTFTVQAVIALFAV
jgi:hypothetical protein